VGRPGDDQRSDRSAGDQPGRVVVESQLHQRVPEELDPDVSPLAAVTNDVVPTDT